MPDPRYTQTPMRSLARLLDLDLDTPPDVVLDAAEARILVDEYKLQAATAQACWRDVVCRDADALLAMLNAGKNLDAMAEQLGALDAKIAGMFAALQHAVCVSQQIHRRLAIPSLVGAIAARIGGA